MARVNPSRRATTPSRNSRNSRISINTAAGTITRLLAIISRIFALLVDRDEPRDASFSLRSPREKREKARHPSREHFARICSFSATRDRTVLNWTHCVISASERKILVRSTIGKSVLAILIEFSGEFSPNRVCEVAVERSRLIRACLRIYGSQFGGIYGMFEDARFAETTEFI